MKKIICKREYDTEEAAEIKKIAVGEFGSEEGYEETLYQTVGGLFFIYVNGGAASIYPTENIKAMSKIKAEAWLEEHK
ncbi:MAG: hypothetical protein RR177_00420 [Oscillospiraceae bacterium]